MLTVCTRAIIIKNGFQIWGSCHGERSICLANACAHAGIKAIGVKTTVITSAIFAVYRSLQSEEET